MSRPRALLLTHGLSRAGLAAARALGRGGWDVGVGSPRTHPLAGASRATRWTHWVPTPGEGPGAFIAAVRDAVAEREYEVVFGADDAEVMALTYAREEIPAVVPYPDHAVVLRALDKAELTEAASGVGLGVPSTDVVPGAAPSLPLPVVVKARLHGAPGTQGARHEAVIVDTPEEAASAVAEVRAGGADPIAQEVVRGGMMALVVLAGSDSELLSCVQQEAVLTWPDEAGVTVRGRTMAIDPGLRDGVQALMRSLGWTGLAELQFLRREEDGEPLLIDLNGRFYGSLALANASGPNLPAAWAALTTGRPLPPLPEPRVGVRYQWLEGELRRAYAERSDGLVRQVASALRFAPGAAHSIWSVRDPRPAARHVRVLAGRALRRAPR